MDKLLYEYEVRKVNIETLKVEKDRAKFLKRSLSFINSILRKAYGIKVLKSRRKGASSYIITQTKEGKLFTVLDKNEAVPSNSTKPVIFSKLEKIPVRNNTRKFTPRTTSPKFIPRTIIKQSECTLDNELFNG